MKYGFFDESKKEYVITRPDTPAPWVNYLDEETAKQMEEIRLGKEKC